MKLAFRILAALLFLFFGGNQVIFAQIPASDPVGPDPIEKPLFSIGIIADAQYCDCDQMKNRYYRISAEKLNVAVDTFNARNVDYVVNLGDLIDQSLESYPIALRALDRLKMPIFNVLGNHEFWDVPFHAQASVLDSLDLGSNYCVQEVSGWRLIMLDGTDLAEYAQGAHPESELEGETSRAASKGKHNGFLWNGAIGKLQMEWLRRQIAEAAWLNQPVAIFCHFPIQPENHGMTLWNNDIINDLIAQYPTVEAWFSGHAHEGGYNWVDGIHHVTMQGMLMTPDSNAFAILNFYQDRIEMQGFGREPSRILPLKSVDPEPAITTLPALKTKPDVLPPPEFPCQEIQIKNALNQTIFIGESGGLEPAKIPKLQPGVYWIKRIELGKSSFERCVILPESKD